ncbi:MAG: PD-(D/E)XK nuclease domain-containing protein [Myxococcota bacterium]
MYGVLKRPYSSWFGFTQHEVKQLLQQRGYAQRFEAVRRAYDGYRFGGGEQPLMIYNPWSVVNDLLEPTQEPSLHWVNTSDNSLIRQLLTQADAEVKEGLHELLSETTHHTTTQFVKEHVPLREIRRDPKNLWGLLLASGYLTAAQARENPGADNKIVQLCIPNDEVRRLYTGLVTEWLTGPARGINGAKLLDTLVQRQVQDFADYFTRFALESTSYFDQGGEQPERFYHGFVLGMMQHLQDRYIVDSQRESGLGRYDLALEPRDKTLPGFVIEFKTCIGDATSLNDTAQQALQQIQDKQYHVELTKRGVRPIIALGLAFAGKQVAVAHTELTQGSST